VTTERSFASDNVAGVHPAIMAAFADANRDHALAYGHDQWTETAIDRLRQVFGATAEPQLVFGGTAANVLALRPFVDSFHSVLCARTSHLWMDECGAPERFFGCKLVPIASPDGKLTPELVRPELGVMGAVHHAQPRAISVAQATEWGTLYQPDELRALADLAHEHDMILHVDGARLANAAAALDLPLGAFGAEAGVDVLSFGATKNGAMFAEAVIYFDADVARRAGYLRKQGMQLASKMRFLAAQVDAMLAGELWRELAAHANAMATRLGDGLAPLAGVELVRPVQTNAVFARLPPAAIPTLQAHTFFHVWKPDQSICRLMTAWDTRTEDVDSFVAAATEALSTP